MASFLIDWRAFLRHFPAFYDFTASTTLRPVALEFGGTLEASNT
jgi:hypothetical protein